MASSPTQIPRYVTYALFCQTVQMFMSYDGGATPASIDEIQSSSGIIWTQAELGLLGSLDKFGMTMSSVLWGVALQYSPAKPLLLLGLGLNAVSTLAFGRARAKHAMFAAKLLMGVTQGLQCVWSTCWTLARAPARMRTLWLGLGAVCAGVGNGLGTAVAGFSTSEGMPYAFAWELEAGVLGVLWLLMLACPAGIFAIGLKADDQDGERDEEDEGGSKRPGSSRSETGKRRQSSRWRKSMARMRKHWEFSVEYGDGPEAPVLVEPSSVKSEPTYGEDFSAQLPLLRIHTASSFSPSDPGSPASVETYSLGQQIRTLAGSPLYIWTALAIASVMFVMSGVQFLWVRVYIHGWGIDKNWAVTSCLVCNGVGGALGVAIGPRVIDRCGGFADQRGRWRSLKFIACMLAICVCGGATNIAVLVAKCHAGTLGTGGLSSTLLWASWGAHLMIFVGFNASLAGLTGINVGSLSVPVRSFGSGCTVSVQNLLGYALGPLLPGAIMDHLRVGRQSIDDPELLCWGFGSVQFGTLLALGWVLAAMAGVRPKGTWQTESGLREAAAGTLGGSASSPLLSS